MSLVKAQLQQVPTPYDHINHHSPSNHLAPPLPILAALKPRVMRHQLLQDRVQLVFGAHPQPQGVHERDEALSGEWNKKNIKLSTQLVVLATTRT